MGPNYSYAESKEYVYASAPNWELQFGTLPLHATIFSPEKRHNQEVQETNIIAMCTACMPRRPNEMQQARCLPKPMYTSRYTCTCSMHIQKCTARLTKP
jgi:hypothetical protein